MRCRMVFIAIGVLVFLCGMAGAQTIVCDGRTCGGTGTVSYGGLRDYVYRVTGAAVPPGRDSIFIGTHDPDLTHYSSFCLPTGWAYEIIPIIRPDYTNPINHSVVSPTPDSLCPYTILFRNVSGAALSSSTATDFGFNYHGYPHTVDWRVAGSPAVSTNWAAGVGIGAGPVHGPRCDTLCEIGYPTSYHYLAGRKDNFATTDGSEPSSPSPALLAYMQTISGGADPNFDALTGNTCFGHTFTGWNDAGCIIGAQLHFRITAISEGNNDFINIREDAVTAVWGPTVKFLKAWHSGNPADTFWTIGDTLEVTLDLANMPLIKRGPTYYWPTNILATLQDGDMDFLMSDDTKIDYLELTLEVCGDIAPQMDTVVIYDLMHTKQGNASLDTTAGKLIVSNIGSSGNDGVSIDLLDTLELWEGVLENFDLSGSVPVGAKLELAYKSVIDGIPDQPYMITSQTKTAANQWQLGATSPSVTTYTVEAWRDGWVVFHADSLSASDLGYIVETAKGVYPAGFKGASTGKPGNVVSTGWEFGASPDGVQWTWAAQGVTNLTIDELVVSPPGPPDTDPHELRSVTILAKNIPSFTIRHERKADIDTATVFGQYHLSEGFANITSVGNPPLEMGGFDFLVGLKEYAGEVTPGELLDTCDWECRRWTGTVENTDTSGTLSDSAKMRVLFRGTINGKPDQPLMALFQTKRASNQWGLGVSSITSTYTVDAKRHNAVVFHGTGMAAADLGYVVETAKGVYPVGFKGSSTGKPASIVSTGWNLGASPDGVQWTWAAHGVANLTIDELEISWTTPNVVFIGDVSVMVMDIPTFTIIDEVRSTAVKAGDANDDGSVNVGDAVYMINYIFKNGPTPSSKGQGDANGDCKLNVGDAVYLINYIFKNGNPPILNDHCIW